ncbi:MAG TPA: hypothetical protein DCY79_03950 [Planctomycetaceae bacterium]|nr:hypothetical protein [Blastopirellula sp.]HAY78937.1 hypothetical protein [Planctomycetaceae bacterium]
MDHLKATELGPLHKLNAILFVCGGTFKRDATDVPLRISPVLLQKHGELQESISVSSWMCRGASLW